MKKFICLIMCCLMVMSMLMGCTTQQTNQEEQKEEINNEKSIPDTTVSTEETAPKNEEVNTVAEEPEVEEEVKAVVEEPKAEEEVKTVVEEPKAEEEVKTVVEEPKAEEEVKVVVEEAVAEEPIVDEYAAYKDGTYEGIGKGHNGDIKVNVTISSGNISGINVLEQLETEAIFNIAKDPVTKAIVEKNSTDVDTVTGATKSSQGIIAAVENALEKAK